MQVTRLNSFTIGGDFNLYNLLVAPVTDGHQFLFNMAGWFVVSLFLVEVYNILIRKCLKQVYHNIPEWIFFIISIALGITGNQLACMGYLEFRTRLCLVGHRNDGVASAGCQFC